MDGDDENQQRDNDRAGQRLARVKAHGRPRGGIAAGVVDGVHPLEEARRMHRPVRPVKPRIVREEIQQHRERRIP